MSRQQNPILFGQPAPVSVPSGVVECETEAHAAALYDVLEKHGLARLVAQHERRLAAGCEWVWALLTGLPHASYLDSLLTEIGVKEVETAWRLGGARAYDGLWLEAGRRVGARMKAEAEK